MRSKALEQDNQRLDPELRKRLSSYLGSTELCSRKRLGRTLDQKYTSGLTPSTYPSFAKPSQYLPFGQREAVVKEFERLEREGIMEPVPYTDWKSPVVTVVKEDGSLRLCRDYRRSVNRARVDQYPLPPVSDMFAQLSGYKRFTKIDLSQACLQLTFNEESQKLTTMNAIKGLYKFRRLPFGIASASAIFQRAMESLLQGIPCVLVRADDILVSGCTDKEHLAKRLRYCPSWPKQL